MFVESVEQDVQLLEELQQLAVQRSPSLYDVGRNGEMILKWKVTRNK
jgi:hypothetical protein